MKKIVMMAVMIAAIVPFSIGQVKIDKYTFGELRARNIGPAVMSGRISAIDAVHSDSRIMYVGSAGGGIWKTTNGGTKFKAVFEEEIQSIGAITIDQIHPDTVWTGTGEPWTRNSVSIGDGVYVTYDGGKEWKKKGLENTERIARIVIHPEDPNTVFVAALGPLWAESPDRGLYKTTDGGDTWEKILYVDENTGCSGLAVDPENPDLIYAGMWDFRRKGWFFRSGGPGSSFHKSTDGGKTWTSLEEEFTGKPWGRIYVDFSPADPNKVYVLIEAEETSLYRSDDKGEKWELVNNSNDVNERPFYFCMFVPDPVDSSRIYKPGFRLQMSEDGGNKFMSPGVAGGNFHSDVHDMWIDPQNNNFIYLATDGGIYISYDQAKSWSFCRNLPLSQFYHVNVDNEKPYNVFGGLQDNGSWIAPSKAAGGITNASWRNVGFGDGFNVVRDPKDNNLLYWQWQGGNLRRMFIDTRENKDIKPYSLDGTTLRYNWNTPLVIGATSSDLYTASQYLYRSSDQGDNWEVLSADLTTNDPAKLNQEQTGGLTIDNSTAENHCTIYTIGESPLDDNIIWVGTDDGNLQVTKDRGKSWTNVAANVPDLPAATWVSFAEPSPFDKATAFVTFDGHTIGDMSTYIYKTTDYGQTWTSLVTDGIEGYCNVVKQDLKNPDLIFLGTELGLYVTIDGGQQWTRFTGNLPKVSVRDMVFQTRENDLVLATHGRGIYIIDDITPLQQLTTERLNENLVFLDSRPYKLGHLGGVQAFNGDDDFRGDNPSTVVNITYYMKKRHIFGDMFLEVFNEDGEKIKTLPAGKRKGINRVKWRMVMEKPKVPSSVQLLGWAMQGPSYPPGDYLVKIIKNKDTIQGTVKVAYDENPHHSIADRDERHKYIMQAYYMLEDLAYLDNQIIEIRNQSASKADSVKGGLSKKLTELSAEMADLRTQILATKEGRITGEKRLRERIGDIYGGIISYQGKPTTAQINGLEELSGQMKGFEEQVNVVIDETLPGLNTKLVKADIPAFKLTEKETFLEKD